MKQTVLGDIDQRYLLLLRSLACLAQRTFLDHHFECHRKYLILSVLFALSSG